jgi:hypothetical protein
LGDLIYICKECSVAEVAKKVVEIVEKLFTAIFAVSGEFNLFDARRKAGV